MPAFQYHVLHSSASVKHNRPTLVRIKRENRDCDGGAREMSGIGSTLREPLQGCLVPDDDKLSGLHVLCTSGQPADVKNVE